MTKLFQHLCVLTIAGGPLIGCSTVDQNFKDNERLQVIKYTEDRAVFAQDDVPVNTDSWQSALATKREDWREKTTSIAKKENLLTGLTFAKCASVGGCIAGAAPLCWSAVGLGFSMIPVSNSAARQRIELAEEYNQTLAHNNP